MLTRRYHVFDVFTDRALTGNPLAVVLDTDGLDTAAMQAIAREFNLSETVFALPAANPAHSAHARIFTPARELPFAGHPTVGAAVCLTLERFGGDGEHDAVVVLEEAVGLLRCGVTVRGGRGFAEFDCPKLPERQGEAEPKELMADVLGIAPAEIGFENHVPSLWSAGNPFAFVPLRDQGVLAQAAPGGSSWRQAFGDRGAFLYTRDTEGHDHAFRARMFAPELGLAEDPATGSAAAAFAGAVHDFDALPDGEHSFVIEQGFEMGRPSLIRMAIVVSGGAITVVRIGGHAVRVMSGTISV
jgi:trans-2,3-dihydro-3-hydroxyanthranilate isomerase